MNTLSKPLLRLCQHDALTMFLFYADIRNERSAKSLSELQLKKRGTPVEVTVSKIQLGV
jgi:hypothetical protein